MLRIGLTGGIGAGKSVVSAHLASLGAVVIDSDVLAREAVAPGTPGLAAVVEAFGDEMLLPDGRLDRPRLGAAVFGDDEARARLNAIVHPLVGQGAAQRLAAAPADAIVVHDVPLLIENGLAPQYHLVLVVDATADARRERLVATRGMAEGDARARMAVQATDEQRRAAADVLITNDGSLDDVRALLGALWVDRLVPYGANLAAGLAAAPPIETSAYDPEWPAHFSRAAARLAVTLGERALRIDHVGPTSVPGTPAPDVLDIQVSLRAAADLDAVASPLAELGWFPGASAHLFEHADPGRPARLQLREAG